MDSPASSSSAHSHPIPHAVSAQRGACPVPPSLPPYEFCSDAAPATAFRTWEYPTSAALQMIDMDTRGADLQAHVRDPFTHPHVALRAASPQSMVSSRSGPGCDYTAAAAAAASKRDAAPLHSPPPYTRAASRKKSKNSDRNCRPCGNCSSSKRKCKVISAFPHLCERCRNHGLAKCPPHISWTRRKASGSLSPLDTDERALSSRSASPQYMGAGRSPIGCPPAGFENEQGTYVPSMTTQVWVQMHATTDGVSAGAHGANENGEYNLPPPGLAPLPQCVQQDVQNNANLFGPARIVPVCHVCNTPYDQFLLSYALAAAMSSPYEESSDMSNHYGQMSPAAGPFENSN